MTAEQQEILEGNKLIAEFMGIKKDDGCPIYIHGTLPNMVAGEFTYHSDWNRLISAHNKARKLFFTLDKPIQKRFLESDSTYIERFGFVSFFATFENQYHIMSSWRKMVDFAKWYNQQTDK